MRFIEYIIIHCSAGYGTVSAIKRFWKEVLGWKEVGYHYYILLDGTVIKLLDISKISNGVKGFNSRSVNISYQGGVDPKDYSKAVDTRTFAQKEAIITVIKEVYSVLEKTQDVSGIKIRGHRDFSPDKNGNGVIESWERIKECPSFNAIPEYAWMQGAKAFNSKTLLSFILPFLFVFLLSCGSKKKVAEQSSRLTLTQSERSYLDGIINEQSFVYGGFLQGKIPFRVLQNDGDSVVVESEGTTLKLQNNQGELGFQATAKPKEANTKQSTFNFQNQKDTGASEESNASASNTRTGLQLPAWLWIAFGCAIIIGVALTYKRLINLFKNLLK